MSGAPEPTGKSAGARILFRLGAAFFVATVATHFLKGPSSSPSAGAYEEFVFVLVGVAWTISFALAGAAGRKRAAAIVIGIVVALAAMEAAARVFLGPYFATLYRANDVWLFEQVPGTRRIDTFAADDGSQRRVSYDVNSDGFRGPELLPRGAARRVVVYGDSFVAGRVTPLEKTFAARLAAELEPLVGARVETVNAGVIGYGPDQCLLRMDAELPRLLPDLVVFVVTAENDYGDLVRDRLFELGPRGELVRRRPPASMDAPGGGLLVARTLTAFGERVRAALHASPYRPPAPRADEALEYELLQCRAEHYAAVVEHVDAPISEGPDHPDADVRLEPTSDSARSKTALLAAVLAAVRDRARAAGVPLLFVVVPAAADACEGYDMDVVDVAKRPGWRPDNLTRPIDSAAETLGVPYVDLFGPFRASQEVPLYRRGGDTHWTDAGQALAAKLVARRVAELRLLR